MLTAAVCEAGPSPPAPTSDVAGGGTVGPRFPGSGGPAPSGGGAASEVGLLPSNPAPKPRAFARSRLTATLGTIVSCLREELAAPRG